MAFSLGPRAAAGGYRLIAHASIGSTSAEALAHARAGDPGKLWIAAHEQTAGHGRRGRPWQTPAGNLAASLLVASSGEPPRDATLGFAAGLALDEAIRACAPEAAVSVALDGSEGGDFRLRLKWPNDVLVDGAKVAGILLEATAGAMVVGFGVNVLHPPDDVPYPSTSLAACGATTDAETLLEALTDAWIAQEAAWDGGRGFAAVRRRWLDRAAGLGAPIAVKSGGQVFRGTFETIDEEGRLVVRAPDGMRRTVAAGDVHFGAVATTGS